jgi:hypothetical protein
MAQALTLTYGRVKYIPGEPRQTSHGMRINAVITLPLGEEIKLWGDPGDPALTALTKGQQVALAQNAKGELAVSTTAGNTATTPERHCTKSAGVGTGRSGDNRRQD